MQRLVILGAGTAGTIVANRLRRRLSLPTWQITVVDHETAHLYQPGTRRPYGVLEWPAMLRLLEAEQKTSGYPPYWQ